jgi:hypothetical protein
MIAYLGDIKCAFFDRRTEFESRYPLLKINLHSYSKMGYEDAGIIVVIRLGRALR